MSELAAFLPEPREEAEGEQTIEAIKVAIIGRPNVGKSTLVNHLLGTQRVIVNATPGTTRDAVDSVLEHRGQRYLLIDTAGIRRKGRIREKLEKVSILRPCRASTEVM